MPIEEVVFVAKFMPRTQMLNDIVVKMGDGIFMNVIDEGEKFPGRSLVDDSTAPDPLEDLHNDQLFMNMGHERRSGCTYVDISRHTLISACSSFALGLLKATKICQWAPKLVSANTWLSWLVSV
jgi:hypothetical protein